jgi:hypothetical protein
MDEGGVVGKRAHHLPEVLQAGTQPVLVQELEVRRHAPPAL